MILVALECHDIWDGLKKIRVPFKRDEEALIDSKVKTDSSQSSTHHEGRRMEAMILEVCRAKSLLGPMSASNISSSNDGDEIYSVQVYDPNVNAFVSLREMTCVEMLGTKIRAVLSKDSRKTNALQATVSRRQDDLLMIEGRYFPYDPRTGIISLTVRKVGHQKASHVSSGEVKQKVFEEGSSKMITLVVQEEINAASGTGLNVWDGSLLLARYLECQNHLVDGKRVLELGAGCGVVGLVCAALGAERVMMTDLPYTMDLLQWNIHNNDAALRSSRQFLSKRNELSRSFIECDICDWHFPEQSRFLSADRGDNGFHVIVVADCVWLEELVVPLMKTMIFLSQWHTKQKLPKLFFLLSYQRRGKSTHDLFTQQLHSLFNVTHLDLLDTIHSNSERGDATGIPIDKFFLMQCEAK